MRRAMLAVVWWPAKRSIENTTFLLNKSYHLILSREKWLERGSIQWDVLLPFGCINLMNTDIDNFFEHKMPRTEVIDRHSQCCNRIRCEDETIDERTPEVRRKIRCAGGPCLHRSAEQTIRSWRFHSNRSLTVRWKMPHRCHRAPFQGWSNPSGRKIIACRPFCEVAKNQRVHLGQISTNC